MNNREYWIIARGIHRTGCPIGETLFRGSKEEAILHTLEAGNEGAQIVRAEIFMNEFLAVVHEG